MKALKEGEDEARASLAEPAKPFLLAALQSALRLPLLVLTPQPESARRLYDSLLAWCPPGSAVLLFPEPDVLPYERLAPDIATVQDRLTVLAKLSKKESSPLIVASAHALAFKTIPYKDFLSASLTLQAGMRLDIHQFLAHLQELGYEMEDTVQVPGTASRRGGILDIFPPSSELPARIELLGDEIESLRLFDPQSQRSVKPIDRFEIYPAREMLIMKKDNGVEELLSSLGLEERGSALREKTAEELSLLLEGTGFPGWWLYAPLFNTGCLLDYLPPHTLLVLDEPQEIAQAAKELDSEARELKESQVGRGELPADFPSPYFAWEELVARWEKITPPLLLERWASAGAHILPFSPAPSYGGRLPLFLKDIKQSLSEKKRVLLLSHQASRLSELLAEADIYASPRAQLEKLPPPGSLTLLQGSLGEGWTLAEETLLLTDAEIFGIAKQRRPVKRRPVRHLDFLSELRMGDYVVHIEHGVARFAGTTRMRPETQKGMPQGAEREYLVLEYAAGDKLYVPADQVERVSRYIGPSEAPPALSRLGTQEWSRAKQRVREAVGILAQELLQLYASREVVEGFAFSSDTPWQQELESSFPFVETPDQLETVTQVKEDMEKPKPMDRLVCGDVGYGKTEVAVRAAFKAVMDGKQVAMLVPTTVLAQQHFVTFKERLGAFPVMVEMLSRFRSEKEQRAILEGLTAGTVDICIGTHRLLQKDVSFKDLGLVIIDEEQRFGVAHKERLKQMRKEVDVLTLSATPIPRTLHMALAGVRDMSTMETPPEDRLPIKTYVAEYDDKLVREALLREMERNGQAFFVHNRVHNISPLAKRLEALVPEAQIAVGHGQMPEEELERVMWDFSQGKHDVLLATTIIESGLDLPKANTLVVNDADRLGLTQLYQLRGRVGRGGVRAYAYFLYPPGKALTLQAKKRLQTIFEATELGAGFHIAMKDLEIRGAGNLLGTQQSGHIGAVGFDLYCRLLTEAVEELKAQQAEARGEVREKKAPLLPTPSLNLPLPAFLPAEYIPDLPTRLALYKRLAQIARDEEIEELAQELADRFGKAPKPVENLLYMVGVKLLAAAAGVESLLTEEEEIVIKMRDQVPPRLKGWEGGVKMGRSQVRLNPSRLGKRWQKVLLQLLLKMSENPSPSNSPFPGGRGRR